MTSWLIDSFTSLADAIGNFIALGIEIIVHAVFYPVTMLGYWMSAILNLIFEPIIEFNNNLMLWDNLVFDFLLSILTNMLPLTHLILVFTGITIVLAYRIYHYLKDVHILGNSI